MSVRRRQFLKAAAAGGLAYAIGRTPGVSFGQMTGVSGFADYKARMKEGQEVMYYITADTLAAAKNSPQLMADRPPLLPRPAISSKTATPDAKRPRSFSRCAGSWTVT